MSNELQIKDINMAKIGQLPEAITNQYEKLKKIETNVIKSAKKAADAKEKAEDAKVKMGLFDYSKKDAIELLQIASKGLAEGLITASEAQTLFFEYQTELFKITKYLFGLGASNIAMNRTVVRELELRLKNASEDEISDLAKQELKNVVVELKLQEDVMKKQEDLTKKIFRHNQNLELINHQWKVFNNLINEQEQDIKLLTEYDLKQESINISYSEKLLKHDEIFEKQSKINNNSSTDIADLNQLINDSKKQINLEIHNMNNLVNQQKIKNEELIVNISNQNDLITNNSKILMEHNEKIVKQRKLHDELSIELSKNHKKLIDQIILNEEEIKKYIADTHSLTSENQITTEENLSELKTKVFNLEEITSKYGWKTIISFVSIGSLILNLLQIFGAL